MSPFVDAENERGAPAGDRLRSALHSLAAADAGAGEVRGAGLFLALDLLAPEGGPDGGRAAAVVNDLREQRILISASGAHGNILKIRPPLVFDAADADRLLEGLASSLSNTAR